MEILKDIAHNYWKNVVILILLLVIGCSCGSRKVETIKRDSISINNNYQEGTKIVLANNYTFRPIDSLKPFKINGQEYDNVAITINKDKTIEKWKNRYITKTIVTEKSKKTEKTDYTIMIIGLGLVVMIGAFLFYKFQNT